jgi:NAD(P)-dependent dehydrogenase (short-subunit alcohol dehydrogenase family)
MGRVQDKVALVTGGASGIGFAAAKLFVAEGATVVVADRNAATSTAAVAELGQRARFHRLDVTREDEWVAVTDAAVRDFGRIDILVNNAGVVLFKDIEATTLDEWRDLMAVNLDGVFLGCKHAVRVMKDRGGGAIVNMSSVAGMIGHGSLSAYCASKGGVRLLTKSVALHCARKGYDIRCNSVHPSFAETPMLQSMIGAARNPEKLAASFASAAPLGRLAQPIEIARTILFLASDESAFTTGAEMVVDGGLTAA